jgi:hypothetical protein
MRLVKSATLALAVVLTALPIGAAIKAMNLTEMMTITSDVAHVRILEKSSFRLAYPFPEAVYTELTVKGTSLRTGKDVETTLVFLGSHDPKDQYGVSEMPTIQDTRKGSEVVVFFYKDTAFPGERNVLFNLGAVYRVEKTFGNPVVIGKGEGFPFPENVKLEDARLNVRATHLAMQAGK